MSLTSNAMVHDATLWEVTVDGYGGYAFGLPTPIKVRWEQREEIFVGRLNRTELVSKAVVYMDRDVVVGDFLYLGKSKELNPASVNGAYQVQRFDKSTDLRGLQSVRKAVL